MLTLPRFCLTFTSLFLQDVLSEEKLETIRSGCDAVVRKMMSHDDARIGNRGSHRYSFGSAPAHFGHFAEWNALADVSSQALFLCLHYLGAFF